MKHYYSFVALFDLKALDLVEEEPGDHGARGRAVRVQEGLRVKQRVTRDTNGYT